MSSAASENELSEFAQKCKTLAEHALSENSPGTAFMYFCYALEAKPDWKDALRNDFSSALCDWGKILEHEEKFDDLFLNYQKALDLYPDNEIITNNLGAHLCRLQQPIAALQYFKKALQINENYLPAYINVQVTKSILVERWHFRMLNDTTRNQSYMKAITKRVNQGYKDVLDIGSGTGLLSIYAKNAGADNVYGCDFSEVMVSISRKVLEANKLFDSIPIINKMSTDLVIPDDIPKRISLVVTETFDGGLLGEHILKTLIHAWENLLEPQCFGDFDRVIPKGAILYIAPIECLHIARQNIFLKSRISRDSFISGLSKLSCQYRSEEPYDTENLKNANFTLLASPEVLFEFNFNNLSQLRKYYHGEIKKNSELKFKRRGYFDAFAVWFDLILDDDLSITSSPLYNTSCCWDQAIFPQKEEKSVHENETVILKAACENGILSIEDSTVNVPEVSKSIISFLNSESYLRFCIDTVQQIQNQENILVLELSTFPYIGLMLLESMNSQIIVSNHKEDILNDIKTIVSSMEINMDKISFIDWTAVLDKIQSNEMKFDIIVLDVIETSGLINEELIGLVPLLRGLFNPNGFFVPSRISVCCQLIFSEDLESESEVQALNDLHIPTFINEYKVSQTIDINLHQTNYTAVSEQFEIGSLELNCCESEQVFENKVKALKNGTIAAVAYYFKLTSYEGTNFSTIEIDSPINHAASLIDQPLQIKSDMTYMVKLNYNSGGMRFYVTEGGMETEST